MYPGKEYIMSRIRKKLVVAVIGELVLTVLMQYIPQNIYAKSDKTVKTAFENYVSGTLVPMYGVLQTDTVESTKDYDWTAEDFRGLLSASVMDFDSDGQLELLTVQFSNYDSYQGKGIQDMYLEMYEYQDSGEIAVSAQKNLDINGYSYASIGYYQTCIFTYEYQGETYIGIDHYTYANGSIVTLSVLEYGKSGFEEMIVPHTNEVVTRTTFDYIGGAGYQMAGNGDIYVRYTNNEPQNPLDCSRWAWKKMYAEETDPLLTEQDKEEYMDAYRMFLEKYGLKAEDERIGMSENGKFVVRNETDAFETAPNIYNSIEGNITFLSGMYTDQGADSTVKLLLKEDCQGSLDEMRMK